VSRALTTLEASSFAIRLYQALNLDARITADLLQKTQYRSFVSLVELQIMESNQRGLNPSIAIFLGVDGKLHRSGTFEELADLFKSLDG
jgi:hypothetical protein